MSPVCRQSVVDFSHGTSWSTFRKGNPFTIWRKNEIRNKQILTKTKKKHRNQNTEAQKGNNNKNQDDVIQIGHLGKSLFKVGGFSRTFILLSACGGYRASLVPAHQHFIAHFVLQTTDIF